MKRVAQHPKPPTRRGEPAFTRVECVIVIATLALLIGIAYPLLAASKADTARVLCLNNLRQIGQAYAGWKNEHGNTIPQQVDATLGGTKNSPFRQNAWVHYMVLSNHLATPQRLACPADAGASAARNWSSKPFDGLAGPIGLGDRAVSYFVGLHGFLQYPSELIAGDYRLVGLMPANCGVAGVIAQTLSRTNQAIGWTNYPHPSAGNLLLNDGRVTPAKAAQLRALALAPGKYEADQTHLINPNR